MSLGVESVLHTASQANSWLLGVIWRRVGGSRASLLHKFRDMLPRELPFGAGGAASPDHHLALLAPWSLGLSSQFWCLMKSAEMCTVMMIMIIVTKARLSLDHFHRIWF